MVMVINKVKGPMQIRMETNRRTDVTEIFPANAVSNK